MKYRVELKPAAKRELEKLPREIQERILEKLTALAENPRLSGVEAMKGLPKGYRIRVGDYRIVYQILDELVLVLVLRVRHRRDVYRNL